MPRILEHSNRSEWLAQRRFTDDGRYRVTATEAASLYHGPTSVWEKLRCDKHTPPPEFDSPAMEWGRRREPEIAEWAQVFIDSDLRPEHRLYISDDDERFAASPDMVAEKPEGLILAEIKTTSKPLTRIPRRYMAQMQWQMMVTGATACWFIWEQHHSFTQIDSPEYQLVEPDEEFIGKLAKVAAAFCDGAPRNGSGQVVPDELFMLHDEAVDYKQHAARLQQRVKEIMDELLDGKDGILESPLGQARRTTITGRTTWDTTRLAHDHPELKQGYTKTSKPQTRVTVTLADNDGKDS